MKLDEYLTQIILQQQNNRSREWHTHAAVAIAPRPIHIVL